ncbi:hypothetical protein N3K66_005342 [Trichothecium roseum]|uniref:Uncharacterized protein n=1 Tax=Trichothecium roseum TaxID=47278 RepID=A0ACC0UXP8_9HYPO|nr:hypothetical protein N3K66_005342 [Trichothecium roseum]
MVFVGDSWPLRQPKSIDAFATLAQAAVAAQPQYLLGQWSNWYRYRFARLDSHVLPGSESPCWPFLTLDFQP